MLGIYWRNGMSITKQIIRFAKPLIERLPSVAMAYRYIRDNKQILDDPRETPMGFKLIGNSAMQKGAFEPNETEIVKKILKRVEVIVNVGANIGYYCCLALQKGKYVVAFEPIGRNLRFLYKNVRANHWEDRIEIFPMALSNRIGIIEIFGGGTGASLLKGWAGTPEQYVELVPTSTLDNVLDSRFHGRGCFVLVDIEGAENLMLEGASLLLSEEPKPIWMVEISIAEHQAKGITINPHLLSTFKIFWERGYEAFTADKQLRLVQPAEVESIVKSGKDSLLTHNFLFIENGRKTGILDA
jgi:FkbM family methyltransferase